MKSNKYISNLNSKSEGRVCGCLHVQVITVHELIVYYKSFGYKLSDVTLSNNDIKESYTLDLLNKILYN